MSANSSSLASRPWVLTASWKSVPLGDGGAPTVPAATWAFCSRIAAITSLAGDAARGELARVEPDAHRIVAGAEQDHRAHAGNAQQLVADVELAVVAQVERVAAVVGAHQVNHHRQVRARLLGRDADLADDVRQPRQRPVDPVLHRGLGDLGVGADLEGHRQRQAAVGARLRIEIEQVLDAVDLLLERRRHRLGDDARVGAGKLRPHHDLRRRDLGILGDRQLQDRQRADQEDEDRDHAGEARPVDEEAGDVHGGGAQPLAADAAGAAPGGPGGGGKIGMPLASTFSTCGATGTPGITRCSPSTTTSSPALTLAGDHPHAVDQRPRLDLAELRRAGAGADDEDELLGLVGADRPVGHEHGVVGARAFHAQPRREAGREAALGVVEGGAHPDRAGLRVEPVVDEVDLAGVREALLVGQAHRHLRRAIAALLVAAQPQVGLLAAVEIGVDLAHAGDRGQHRLLVDEVADGDVGARGPPGDRRADLGVFEIEARGAQRRLGALDVGLRGARARRQLVELLARDRLRIEQAPGRARARSAPARRAPWWRRAATAPAPPRPRTAAGRS